MVVARRISVSDASDIGELLQKATHDLARQKRAGWVKGVALLIAAFAGAGWSARAYLEQLPTKQDLTNIAAQYAAVHADDLKNERRQDDRLLILERNCDSAQSCCNTVTNRLDRYTTPRN